MNTVAKYWEIFAKNLHLYLYCYNFGDFFVDLGLWSSVLGSDPINRGPWATGRGSRSRARGHFLGSLGHWSGVIGPGSGFRGTSRAEICSRSDRFAVAQVPRFKMIFPGFALPGQGSVVAKILFVECMNVGRVPVFLAGA